MLDGNVFFFSRTVATYNRSRKRNTLSTRSNGICDVLHVRAGDELARRGEDACADAEFRVRACNCGQN